MDTMRAEVDRLRKLKAAKAAGAPAGAPAARPPEPPSIALVPGLLTPGGQGPPGPLELTIP